MGRLAGVFNRLQKGQFTGLLTRYTEPVFVEGRDTAEYEGPVEVKFFTVPDGMKALTVSADEGSGVLDNRHFYFVGEDFDIKVRDILEYDGVVYEIYGPEPRPHGGFTYAYGRESSKIE